MGADAGRGSGSGTGVVSDRTGGVLLSKILHCRLFHLFSNSNLYTLEWQLTLNILKKIKNIKKDSIY